MKSAPATKVICWRRIEIDKHITRYTDNDNKTLLFQVYLLEDTLKSMTPEKDLLLQNSDGTAYKLMSV